MSDEIVDLEPNTVINKKWIIQNKCGRVFPPVLRHSLPFMPTFYRERTVWYTSLWIAMEQASTSWKWKANVCFLDCHAYSSQQANWFKCWSWKAEYFERCRTVDVLQSGSISSMLSSPRFDVHSSTNEFHYLIMEFLGENLSQYKESFPNHIIDIKSGAKVIKQV